MENKPKISVVVPVYNDESYLNQCLDSILSQTFKDFELILVNDGSTDFSFKICEEYAEKDNRIRLFSQENKGLSASRNIGIENAVGEFITFIDSDDYIHPDCLKKLYNVVQDYQADIVICEYYRYDRETNLLYYYVTEKDYEIIKFSSYKAFKKMFEHNGFISSWGKLYNISLFENIRYQNGRFFEDQYTTGKLYIQAKNIQYLKESLYCYTVTPNSITTTKKDIKKITDDIEGVEEMILNTVLSGMFDTEMQNSALNFYKNRLIENKNFFESRDLIHEAIYLKICQRLTLLEKRQKGIEQQ